MTLHPLPYSVSAERWFEHLRGLPLPVLLSSGSSGHGAARFDIVTADPDHILRSRGSLTQVECMRSGETRAESGSPFSILGRYCRLEEEEVEYDDLPFTGGAIGFFAYELLHENFGIAAADKTGIGLPDMLVGIYPWTILIDHHKKKSCLVARRMDAGRLARLRERLNAIDPGAAADGAGFELTSSFVSNFSAGQYQERFRRIIDYIHAGDCYQVNLAQCFTASCEGDSWTAYKRLQREANAPFAAYIEDGQQAVLSFSPERFIKVDKLEVMTQPIKGTRPRSNDPEQDRKNREELESSLKDRAENLMIVDLLRNDLGRVCSFGSVAVDSLFETQSFTNVHHLVSTIKGRLARAEDVFPLLQACFPGGSITGTPKRRAMEIIHELETMPRSVYCGAIAWIDARGNMDSNICIRTMVRDGDRIHCWGGGGIVADSDGAAEYQETLDKISMLINNL